MLLVVDHFRIDDNVDSMVQSKLVQSRVEMSTVDEVIWSLVFNAEVGFQFREPNHTAVLPPSELNTLGLDNVSAEEWLQPPIQ